MELPSFFSRRRQEAAPSPEVRVGFIGKIRTRPDFVRHGYGHAEVRAFDRWLQEGVAYFMRRFPSDWRERLADFPPINFFIAGEGETADVAGAMVASQDKTGRQHPFVALAMTKSTTPAEAVPYLPAHYADYFAQARRTGDEDGVPWEFEQLVHHHDGLGGTLRTLQPLPGGKRDRLWRDGAMVQLWSALPSATRLARAAFARDLLQTFRMAASRGPQRTAWGIRFPLPAQAAARRAATLFWLRLAAEMLAETKWRPHLFWSDAHDGAPLGLTLFFREPAASALVQILSPETEEGVVVDLARRPLENLPEVTDGRLLSLAERDASLGEAFSLLRAAGGKA